MSESVNSTSNFRTWSPDISNATISTINPKTSGSSSTTDFQQILKTLLLGMAMPGLTGGATASSLGASSGLNLNSLMAPLMLCLIEQLISSQVQTQTAASPQNTAVDTTNAEPSPTPKGMPAQGPITQYPHAGHMALDIGIPTGTELHATMDGKVIYAGWNNEGYGNLVIVQNGPYKVYFGHLSKVDVKVGDEVHNRDVIGLSGSTGNSTGPHVHYEVRKDNVAIDPSGFTLH